MIPQSFIDDLLNRLSVVDVVGRAVTLKKAGANYQSCCPFHEEKTPSFTVSPSKQFYHCFGCGAHGNIIDFTMAWRNLTFVQAIEELAHSAGLSVPKNEMKRAERQPDILTPLLEEASNFYRNSLKGSKRAIEYLKARGVTGQTAARFGLGYAPPGWQSLAKVLKNYEEQGPIDSGLVILNDSGRRYDRFRDRIMFPIKGHRGRIVGFGGRVLDAGEPKYLNSPETRLFEKGRELYGLVQAQRAIHSKNRVLVVEGYMDVVMLHQHGIDYAVATLGTATTSTHAKALIRLADEVIFSFDGDAAGRRAAWRALGHCLQVIEDGKRVKFLFLPDGEDPDSFVRDHGAEAFEKLIETAQSLSRFMLDHLASESELNTEEGRAKFVKQAGAMLQQVTAPVYQLLLRKSVADLAGLSLEELDGIYKVNISLPTSITTNNLKVARSVRSAPSLSRHLVRLILMQPSLAMDLQADEFSGAGTELLRALIEMIKSNGEMTEGELEQQFARSEFENTISRILSEIRELNGKIEVKQEFMDAIEKWHLQQRKRRIGELLKTELTPAQKLELLGLLPH